MAQPGRPSAGDLTGRQKAQQQKEAREEQEARAAEMSMMADTSSEAEANGVFDPQSGERIDSPKQAAVVVAERPRPTFGQSSEPLGGEQVFTGQEDPAEVEPVIAARKQFTPPPVTVRSSMVTIRVDADIEDMTYGMVNGEPNNFTFKEGLAYKVPLAVAEHLNERNLIRQWIAG